MEKNELKSVIEAMIFVSEEPMTVDLMTMALGEVDIKKKEVKEIVEEITNEYNEQGQRGIRLVNVAGGYQFRTKPETADWIKKLNVPKQVRLSQAAMETLAIIAYRQPVLRSDVENVRGVDSGGVIKTLLERGLIRIVGKSDDVGHPLVYGTTSAFLEMFGINHLKELPTLKEISELEAENSGVQDQVGKLGKEDGSGDAVADGISEVIAEYGEDLVKVTIDPEKEKADHLAIKDLEFSVKKVRKLEKEIFPKPKEEITAVQKEGASGEAAAVQPDGAPEQAQENIQNETTSPQDNSTVN